MVCVQQAGAELCGAHAMFHFLNNQDDITLLHVSATIMRSLSLYELVCL
jgi:hypothetical protein